jgi:hypothetical protein
VTAATSPASAPSPVASLRVLLRGVVDYAGLFPPASLGMAAAVAEYASHRGSPHEWALGRFVVAAARLEEFEDAAASVIPREAALHWALSALLGSDVEEDVARIEQFNDRHRDARKGAVLVDTVELKAGSAREIARAGELLDRRFDTYMEVPVADDPDALIAAIAGTMAKAKVRTGGVTADAFPTSAHVIRFMVRCQAHDVSFKATAGLHHSWRNEYQLTYAADAPRGTMFGFLNVLLAAAGLRAGWSREDATAMLEERNAASVHFDAERVRWRDHALSIDDLARGRDSSTTFGSCSFRDPITDLQSGALL